MLTNEEIKAASYRDFQGWLREFNELDALPYTDENAERIADLEVQMIMYRLFKKAERQTTIHFLLQRSQLQRHH